jgi:hypothetical protein
MRWSALFDDLEAQVRLLDDVSRAGEVAELARAEAAQLCFADRVRATTGPIRVHRRDGSFLRGTVVSSGPDWLLLRDEPGDEELVLAGGLSGASGLGRSARAATGVVARRLSALRVLRALAQDRATVVVTLVDGSALTGTIDRVGADFLEIAVHAADAIRRRDEVTDSTALLLSAVSSVRKRS